MPDLGSYLGQILSEITIARMQADLEAVRIAELYASHPLLKNMPVPHFRLPDIEADVPVVIKKPAEQSVEKQPLGTPTVVEMRSAFDKILDARLKEEGIRLTTKQRADLDAALEKTTVSLKKPAEVSVDVKRVADELSRVAAEQLSAKKSGGEDDKSTDLEEKLKSDAIVSLIGLRRPTARLEVLATTAEIKEAGPSETITRFHLKITEDAFEWTTIESESGKEDRLVSE